MSLFSSRNDDEKFDELLFQQLNYALVWIDIARQQLHKKNEVIKNLQDNFEREGRTWANENLSLRRQLEALKPQEPMVVQNEAPPHELEPGWNVRGTVEEGFGADQHLAFAEASRIAEPIALKDGKLKRVRKKCSTVG